MILQNTQQFGLQFHRNIAYFIHEQRSLIRQLHSPNFLANCPRERPLFMAKQLAFEQPGGNRRAVYLDEGGIFLLAHAVNGTRDQFLSRSGFTQNQHRGTTGRHGSRLRQHTLQFRAFAHDFLEIEFAADLVFQVQFFFRQAIFQRLNFPVGASIVERDRQLGGDLVQNFLVFLRKGLILLTAHVECSQRSRRREQGHTAHGANTRPQNSIRDAAAMTFQIFAR